MNEGQFKAFIELLKEIRDISKEIEKQQAELLNLFKAGNKAKDDHSIKLVPTMEQSPKRRIRRS